MFCREYRLRTRPGSPRHPVMLLQVPDAVRVPGVPDMVVRYRHSVRILSHAGIPAAMEDRITRTAKANT